MNLNHRDSHRSNILAASVESSFPLRFCFSSLCISHMIVYFAISFYYKTRAPVCVCVCLCANATIHLLIHKRREKSRLKLSFSTKARWET